MFAQLIKSLLFQAHLQVSLCFSNFKLEQHLVCEPCGERVAGGFDPEKKQVRYDEY